MADVERSNAFFGGTRSALHALRAVIPHLSRTASLLDVGTGVGDVPVRAQATAAAASIELTTVGVDAAESLLRVARERHGGVVAADARRLPFADDSFDVVMCSQLLHHFFGGDARTLVAELHRVSRGWVVVSDLRRSWIAAAGFWLAAVGLRFHPVTRHDGVVSVLRGFTPAELDELVTSVTGRRPHVRGSAFWRLSATWSK